MKTVTAIEEVIREIEIIDHDGMFRSQVDFEFGFMIMPSPAGTIKLAFWNRKHQIMFIECYDFFPLAIKYSSN